MKQLYFILLFILTVSNSVGQTTTLLSESLRDGSIPAGWSGTNIDFRTTADGYALFQGSDSELVTVEVDMSAYDTIDDVATISFDVAKFGSGTNGPLTLMVSEDGGATFTTVGDSPTPTSSTYQSASFEITSRSSTTVFKFSRPNSPSQKRLRDVLLEVIVGPIVPITLANFSIETTDGKANLSWTTLSESNNSHFNVLRSFDGNTFETIGTVQGSGNSSREIEYTFTDDSPNGGDNFYKLEQVDFDGSISTSNILLANFGEANLTIIAVNSQGIELFLPSNGTAQINVYSMIGQRVEAIDLPAKMGSQFIRFNQPITVGVYVVEVLQNNQRKVKKVAIQ